MNTAKRKRDQLEVCLQEDVQAKVTPGFEDVAFIHKALPEVSIEEIDLATTLLGRKLRAPLVIASMTGGTEKGTRINKALAEAAEELGIAIGVGSQRIAIEDKRWEYSFRVVREVASTAFVIANLGCLEIAEGGVEIAHRAIEMVEADALAIHLNPLQEIVQAEGKRDFRDVLEAIRQVAENLDAPIIAKETGAGICREVAMKLEEAGVKCIDVGGAGGTSWSAVEYFRARSLGDEAGERLGKAFWDWGIPTVVSIIEVKASTNADLIATGGVRSGMDVAKSIALGANAAGLAYPLLKPATKGAHEVLAFLHQVLEELKATMLLTGSPSIESLQCAPVVITGRSREWLEARGISVHRFAQR